MKIFTDDQGNPLTKIVLHVTEWEGGDEVSQEDITEGYFSGREKQLREIAEKHGATLELEDPAANDNVTLEHSDPAKLLKAWDEMAAFVMEDNPADVFNYDGEKPGHLALEPLTLAWRQTRIKESGITI